MISFLGKLLPLGPMHSPALSASSKVAVIRPPKFRDGNSVDLPIFFI